MGLSVARRCPVDLRGDMYLRELVYTLSKILLDGSFTKRMRFGGEQICRDIIENDRPILQSLERMAGVCGGGALLPASG